MQFIDSFVFQLDPEYYAIHNAHNWVNQQAFQQFYSQRLQLSPTKSKAAFSVHALPPAIPSKTPSPAPSPSATEHKTQISDYVEIKSEDSGSVYLPSSPISAPTTCSTPSPEVENYSRGSKDDPFILTDTDSDSVRITLSIASSAKRKRTHRDVSNGITETTPLADPTTSFLSNSLPPSTLYCTLPSTPRIGSEGSWPHASTSTFHAGSPPIPLPPTQRGST